MRIKDRDVRRVASVLANKTNRFREDSVNSNLIKLAREAGLSNCGREYKRAVVAIAMRKQIDQDGYPVDF